MADLPTRLDYYQLGRQYVLSRAQKIDPGMVDVQGSDANLFVGTASVLADAVTKQLGFAVSRLLLDSITDDDDLDRYAWDRYQTTRKGASPATTQVRFYRASFAAGGGNIPANTLMTALGGTQFLTTQPATFGATTLDKVIVNARAAEAGKASQVGANQIRRFANPAALFDPSIQVNNDATSAGGEDREDLDTFKNRLRNFWLTARRGVLAAIEFGALTVPGVVSALAQEVITNTAQPARLVQLYIADSSGVASVPMAQAVAVALLDYRAAGIGVIVNTSIPFIQSIQLALAWQTGVDTVTMSAAVQAAIVEFVNSLPVSGTLYLADLYSVLRRFVADGLVQSQASIVSPITDVVPEAGQTIRTDLAHVTLS